MNCKRAEQLMSDYIDGNLDCSTETQFEAHIAECGGCKESLEIMRSMVSSLSRLSASGMQVDCWDGVRSRISGKKPEGRFQIFLRPVIAVSSLAVVVMVAVFLMLLGNTEEDSAYSTATVPEYETYISAHSRLQRQQTMQDPDVTFITAELEKASLVVNATDK